MHQGPPPIAFFKLKVLPKLVSNYQRSTFAVPEELHFISAMEAGSNVRLLANIRELIPLPHFYSLLL